MCWGRGGLRGRACGAARSVPGMTWPAPAGVLPGAAPPGAAHGQRHAKAGLHTQRHHRAEAAGRGPVRSRHQVGAAEDQGPAGRASAPRVFPDCSLCLSLDNSQEGQVCVCFFKPDADMDPNTSGEGVNSVSSSIKRGLSVDSAQEVKRFRTATGAISAVRARAQAASAAFYGSFIQQTLNVGRVPGAMPAGQLGKAAPTARNPTMSHIAGFLDLGHHTFSPYFLHGYPILSPRLLCLSFCGDHARQWCP